MYSNNQTDNVFAVHKHLQLAQVMVDQDLGHHQDNRNHVDKDHDAMP